MDEALRRRYLDALGVALWLPRQPSARIAASGLEGSRVAGDAPEAMETGAAVDRRAENEAERRAEAMESDDFNLAWTPAMDDDRELPDEIEREPLAASSSASRAARIARMDWDELEATVRPCTACALCASRTQTVFGVGDRQADWLVVGEAPGADEDRLGEPFVGRAGKLLNPMLQAIGLQREQVYIANILKCRPPENRDPAPQEAASCRPYLERQIALIRPRIILAVGRIAAQNLLNTEVAIGKLRGRVHRFGPQNIPLVVTYHPAYLLRSPREKSKAWDDLRLARRALALAPPRAR
ncbi:MAG: uracil-DNA glycosylase [Candidatus Competibacteraceae bacterium]|nr:uracil-DNA glycosylase [Candidatus Competibacteraceae bacterium]